MRSEAPHYGPVTGCSPQANHFFPAQSGKKAGLLSLQIVHVCDDFKCQNSYRSRNRENGAGFDPEIQFDHGFLPQISQMVADHEAPTELRKIQ